MDLSRKKYQLRMLAESASQFSIKVLNAVSDGVVSVRKILIEKYFISNGC